MRDTCLTHLTDQGAIDGARRVRSVLPRTLLAYLERRVLPGQPSIVADVTAAALLLGLPCPRTETAMAERLRSASICASRPPRLLTMPGILSA